MSSRGWGNVWWVAEGGHWPGKTFTFSRNVKKLSLKQVMCGWGEGEGPGVLGRRRGRGGCVAGTAAGPSIHQQTTLRPPISNLPTRDPLLPGVSSWGWGGGIIPRDKRVLSNLILSSNASDVYLSGTLIHPNAGPRDFSYHCSFVSRGFVLY